jgi:hypothetical protein
MVQLSYGDGFNGDIVDPAMHLASTRGSGPHPLIVTVH